MSKWKRAKEYLEDYFELRRFERYGLAFLILLGILFFFLRLNLNSKDFSEETDLERFSELIQSDVSASIEVESNTDDESTLNMKPFNPNSVSKEALFNMGIPPSAVKSIINYRSSGFEYRNPEDLLRCYGVDQILFDELAPYVVLINRDDPAKSKAKTAPESVKERAITPFHFDPNDVSRDQLMAMNLPDKFIVGFLNFRSSGARFYSIHDFEKVYALTPELKGQLIPYLIFPERTNGKQETEALQKSIVREIQRFRFDPNQISRDSLLLLGIPESVANIWINYRRGGKVFYEVNDLNTIYGFSETMRIALSGWMDFPARAVYETVKRPKYIQPSLRIDPNKATLEELMKIKGIGPSYGNQILWHRKKLGGFYNINQIGESENLPDSVYQSIRYHFVNPSLDSLKMINVNTIRRRPFADHPYITYDRVNRIITHREFVGRIENIEYLLKLGLLSDDEVRRIGPYLTFN